MESSLELVSRIFQGQQNVEKAWNILIENG